ncbi:hypothetical protein H7F33_05605 [Pedobacter sp. PAMC26386]|nr:hypothetical protein H7F33_05605 [Pedobacter sp. PAMC26386]
MKKILLIASMAIGLIACKKNENIVPTQIVSYDVEGRYILVYVKDNVWQGGHKQHFVVQGRWHYEFENSKLDTAYLELYHGTFTADQHVKATIKVNGKVVKSIDKFYTQWGNTDTLTYNLK